MGTGIYHEGKEVAYLNGAIFQRLQNEIENILDNSQHQFARDEKEIIHALDRAAYGIGFNFKKLFLRKHLALFLVDYIDKALSVIEQSQYPFSSKEKKELHKLQEAILDFAKTLPEKAAFTPISWRKDPLLTIECDFYEKLRQQLSLYIKSSTFPFTNDKRDILYQLEAGSYGFRIGIEDFLSRRDEILVFASYVNQAIDDIQKSAEPFDEATEKKLRDFYQKLLEIAPQFNNE